MKNRNDSSSTTPPKPSLAERFAARFRGLGRAYGHYTLARTAHPGAKRGGKALTVEQPVTLELYEQHLRGTYGLGIVPVTDDAICCFGTIDIDQYSGLALHELEAEIARLGLPLIPMLSKSGGVHLYLFSREPVSAEFVRSKLRDWARALGHPRAEIFPKQGKLEPGAKGNWINLPYFGGDESSRYAIGAGDRLSLEQFLDLADSKAISHAELEALIISAGLEEDEFLGAPPCLQCLAKNGCPDSRNLFLFNLGVYLKKRFGDEYADKLELYNQRFIADPLRPGRGHPDQY